MGNYFVVFRKISIFASWYSAFCWICGHTLYGCVDWNSCSTLVVYFCMCHTLYGCVDWNINWNLFIMARTSHTLYGCVDWNYKMPHLWRTGLVTPCMGVWIETRPLANRTRLHLSHPVWVCGLKPEQISFVQYLMRHTLYGCVDWNILIDLTVMSRASHTLYGCVDWNTSFSQFLMPSLGHTLYGCVDWNL